MTNKILVLGSGMVAKPCVDYLLRNPGNELTIASRTLSTAQNVANSSERPSATAIQLDVESPELGCAIAEHDLVISLVPFVYHAEVIRLAIKGKINVVTTSYISPAMKDLHDAAVEAGITVLNEVGVDPGVDHLYAVKAIGEIHEKGGKYNSATFLRDSEEVYIPNKDLMAAATRYHVKDGYSFVAYPNRNSLPFQELYRIPEARTFVRGSLRYEGNPALVKALVDLGWLDATEKPWLKPGITWSQIQQNVAGAASGIATELISKVDKLCSFRSPTEREQVITGLRWMGIFSDDQAPVRGTLLDTISARLHDLCRFEPGERDLVVLQHNTAKEMAILPWPSWLGPPAASPPKWSSTGIPPSPSLASSALYRGHLQSPSD
ncbi:hypothetical protein DL764_009762 [Monosporascus ibericus]|uniref:Saccharopine dehydrogenase NADP binding domain-containing protein n=1 Tax=Monosporascus ibericus TaxID=155417 RepID=A0A4Q4SX75_9PEZI|nr:hypothetical protein DL764_009762 [Monosporascus ibericus]